MSLSSIPSSILINGPLPEPIRRRDEVHVEENHEKVSNLPSRPSEEVLKRFLDENPHFPLETPDHAGRTLVSLAINAKSQSLINSFLDQDPTIATGCAGYRVSSYVFLAAANTNLKIVQAFAQRGADINAVTETGSTPLFNSSQSAEPEAHAITKFLLMNGAVLYQRPREMVLSDLDFHNGSLEGIAAQPQNIFNAITEIKHEHRNAHKPLSDLTKEKKLFPGLAGLPDVLAAHIMRFLPEAHTRYQYMVNHGHINGPAVKAEEAPVAAEALANTPASSKLSLNEADWNFDFSHEALIDAMIASTQEGAEEVESKESTSEGSSSMPASNEDSYSSNDLD